MHALQSNLSTYIFIFKNKASERFSLPYSHFPFLPWSCLGVGKALPVSGWDNFLVIDTNKKLIYPRGLVLTGSIVDRGSTTENIPAFISLACHLPLRNFSAWTVNMFARQAAKQDKYTIHFPVKGKTSFQLLPLTCLCNVDGEVASCIN